MKDFGGLSPAFQDAEAHDLVPSHTNGRLFRQYGAALSVAARNGLYSNVEALERSRVAELSVCKPQSTRLAHGPRSAHGLWAVMWSEGA